MIGSPSDFFGWLLIRKRQRLDDADVLWRAVYQQESVNKKTGKVKPAFFKDKTGLSCDLASLTTEELAMRGSNINPRPTYSGLVEFSVENVRSPGVDCDVLHKPLSWWRNYAHCQFARLLEVLEREEMVKRCTMRVKPDLPI